MRRIAGFCAAAVLAPLATGVAAEDARAGSERAAYVAPRGPHSGLNGVWQALNEANYDIELHMARASMQLRDGRDPTEPPLPRRDR